MKKTDKKTDNQIIKALTEVCERAKFETSGFVWLTHAVDYNRFPQSLKVTLVFNDSVSEDLLLSEFKALTPEVQAALEPVVGAVISPKQIEARREHSVH
ncbi:MULTISPECIES: hypothetical protein [Gammaproteobacteria]|uniref:hypothetical protein n=1 Tax=Gammaproteobacteria TaxID=1236 RepID=UPI000DD04FC3|nr:MULTISPECIES: hypothetical protein [Gammaproteobacteria]RTE85864.1 hypothetical protein DQX04_10475 [Aliidiomarina sp. B3213]TCZ90136.1 hypothetical protein EYQ95_09985 [Lysobacter sp. N42]